MYVGITQLTTIITNFAKRFWQFFTGIILTLVVFATNFHDFKQPDISLEITAVNTSSSDPLDIVRIPELKKVVEVIGQVTGGGATKQKNLTPEEITRNLEISNSTLNAEKLRLDTLEQEYNRIQASGAGPTLDKLQSLQSVSNQLYFYNYFVRPSNEATDENKGTDKKIEETVKYIIDKLKENKDSLAKEQKNYADAKMEWDHYVDKILPDKAKLIITCAIGNQGSGATALKPQALFRADLGEGNYLDFPISISNYENIQSSDSFSFSPHTYKVIRFQSEEVRSMTESDKQRFKAFLGNASPATLFVSDVRGNTYYSNSVPFSPGVYEQRVIDSLKKFASENLIKK